MDEEELIKNLKKEVELLNVELDGIIEGVFRENVNHLQTHAKAISLLIDKLLREK